MKAGFSSCPIRSCDRDRFFQPNPQKTLKAETIPNLVFGLLITEIMQLLQNHHLEEQYPVIGLPATRSLGLCLSLCSPESGGSAPRVSVGSIRADHHPINPVLSAGGLGEESCLSNQSWHGCSPVLYTPYILLETGSFSNCPEEFTSKLKRPVFYLYILQH